MHIKDYNDAMTFFRNSKQLESNGKWKEFVEESKFDDMLEGTRPQEPRTMAQGGRIGLLNGGDAFFKKQLNKSIETYGEDALNKAAQVLANKNYSELKGEKYSNMRKKIKKELSQFGSALKEEGSRKRSRQKRVLREQDIQIKLLEATNKKGKFNAAKFAKDNDISMKVLKEQSDLLQGSIYDKRMLVADKEMRSTLTWIPEDATISDNALIKLHKSGLITYERTKIDELFYDAFGRKKIKGTNIDNKKFSKKKYLAIKNNLNEYRQLKEAINLKYPSIDFQLDHPLSRSTLNKIFNASADELTRVNVLDAHLNNSFKDSLSQKYENAISTKNLKAKKAVEKVARDLKLNIGKVSTDLKDFKYGVKEFQKLNIRDEIIKSLKNQKDLNLNFKSYIKNNPDLLKIAGYDDPSKIGTKLTKVTDKQIQGIEKILKKKGVPAGERGFIATALLEDFGKLGLKGGRLLKMLELQYEPLLEGLFYQYYKKYKGYDHGLAREELFLPKIIAKSAPKLWEKLGFKPFKTGILEGADPLVEEQLREYGGGEYMDAQKAYQKEVDKYNKLDFEASMMQNQWQPASPEKIAAKKKEIEDQRELIIGLQPTLKPGTNAYENYMRAQEKQDHEFGMGKIKSKAESDKRKEKRRHDEYLEYKGGKQRSFYLPKGKLEKRVEDPLYKKPYTFLETDQTLRDIVSPGKEFWESYGLTGEKGTKEKWKQIYDMGGIDLIDRIGIAGGVSKMAEGGIMSLKKKK